MVKKNKQIVKQTNKQSVKVSVNIHNKGRKQKRRRNGGSGGGGGSSGLAYPTQPYQPVYIQGGANFEPETSTNILNAITKLTDTIKTPIPQKIENPLLRTIEKRPLSMNHNIGTVNIAPEKKLHDIYDKQKDFEEPVNTNIFRTRIPRPSKPQKGFNAPRVPSHDAIPSQNRDVIPPPRGRGRPITDMSDAAARRRELAAARRAFENQVGGGKG